MTNPFTRRFWFSKVRAHDIKNLTILPGVPTFEQLYLVNKILGETLSLKLVLYKYLTKWNLNGMVDIGNRFYLIKFSNIMDRNSVLHGQPWFVGSNILPPSMEKEL